MNASNDGNNNENNEDQRKKGKGRQKIQMVKIENDTNLQVTFSKRRAGIFKKASELSTLCGAESVVLIFSPGDKPHTFGHPDFDTVSNRFLDANNKNVGDEAPQPTTAADQLIAAHSEAAMQQRVEELVSMEVELDQEKRRKREIDQSNKVNPQEPSIEELDRSQLDQMKQDMMGFQLVYEEMTKTDAENTIFNANINHDIAAGSSSWNNNNINHNVGASSMWNNVHDHVAAGTSSWLFSNAATAENSLNWENIANVNPNTQPQGLGFQNSFYDYGGPSMIPPIPNVQPYPYTAVDGGSNLNNFGFTVQYIPPMGPTITDHLNVGVNPSHAFVVPYDIGQGSFQPTANPNSLSPQDPHDPNGGRFHRNNRRPS